MTVDLRLSSCYRIARFGQRVLLFFPDGVRRLDCLELTDEQWRELLTAIIAANCNAVLRFQVVQEAKEAA